MLVWFRKGGVPKRTEPDHETYLAVRRTVTRPLKDADGLIAPRIAKAVEEIERLCTPEIQSRMKKSRLRFWYRPCGEVVRRPPSSSNRCSWCDGPHQPFVGSGSAPGTGFLQLPRQPCVLVAQPLDLFRGLQDRSYRLAKRPVVVTCLAASCRSSSMSLIVPLLADPLPVQRNATARAWPLGSAGKGARVDLDRPAGSHPTPLDRRGGSDAGQVGKGLPP